MINQKSATVILNVKAHMDDMVSKIVIKVIYFYDLNIKIMLKQTRDVLLII